METKVFEIGLSLVLIVMTKMVCNDVAEAQPSCSGTLLSLTPCLSYVTGNSTTPSSPCCTQLLTVIQSQPQCLCSALNGGGATFGVTINKTLAISLPDSCSIKTPPAAQCNGDNGTATPPRSSTPPADDAPEIPATKSSQTTIPPAAGAESGSKTLPSTSGRSASNGGSKAKGMPLKRRFIVILFLASCIVINI